MLRLRQQSNLLDIHTVSLMAVTFGAAHLANVFFPTWQKPLPQSLLSLPTNAWFNGVLLQLLFELVRYDECNMLCCHIVCCWLVELCETRKRLSHRNLNLRVVLFHEKFSLHRSHRRSMW